ncbi:MAG: hypothetical protein AAF488_02000, partial [Planctomycetota bacterium]
MNDSPAAPPPPPNEGPSGLHRSIYLVGNKRLSIHDLLARFSEPQFQHNGITRLSDLHLKTGEKARYRFDSELVELPEATPLDEATLRGLLHPLLSESQIERLEEGGVHDIDASYDWPERKLSFRINAFHDRDGLAAVVRCLPREVPPVHRVGFPNSDVWEELVALQQGLV